MSRSRSPSRSRSRSFSEDAKVNDLDNVVTSCCRVGRPVIMKEDLHEISNMKMINDAIECFGLDKTKDWLCAASRQICDDLRGNRDRMKKPEAYIGKAFKGKLERMNAADLHRDHRRGGDADHRGPRGATNRWEPVRNNSRSRDRSYSRSSRSYSRSRSRSPPRRRERKGRGGGVLTYEDAMRIVSDMVRHMGLDYEAETRLRWLSRYDFEAVMHDDRIRELMDLRHVSTRDKPNAMVMRVCRDVSGPYSRGPPKGKGFFKGGKGKARRVRGVERDPRSRSQGSRRKKSRSVKRDIEKSQSPRREEKRRLSKSPTKKEDCRAQKSKSVERDASKAKSPKHNETSPSHKVAARKESRSMSKGHSPRGRSVSEVSGARRNRSRSGSKQ